MVPNKLFVQLAGEIGLPDPAQLERLDALQMEWARQGRPMSLFELAQVEGILTPDLAERFVRAAAEREAAASAEPASGSSRTKSGSGRTKSGSGRTKSGSGRTKSGSGRTKSGGRIRSSSGARAKPTERRTSSDRRREERRKASRAGKPPAGRERRLGERRKGERRSASPPKPSKLPLIAVGIGALVLAGLAAAVALRPPAAEVAGGGAETKTGAIDPQEVQRLDRLAASESDQIRQLARGGQRDLALARLDTVLGRLRGQPAAANAIQELHTLRAELAAPPATKDEWSDLDRKTRGTPTPRPTPKTTPKTTPAPVVPEGPKDPPPTKKTARTGKAMPWDDDEDDDDDDESTTPTPPPPPRVARRDPPTEPTPAQPTKPAKPTRPTPTTTTPSDTPRAGGKTGGSGAGGLDPEYVARRDALDRKDAKGFTALAKWARRKRLFEEEKEALNLALIANPNHTSAKKLLTKLLAREKKHRNFHTPWRRDAKVIYVETNTSEALLHYYCDSVAAFYQRFSKIFNVRRNPLKAWGKKIGVKIFATRKDFMRYQAETGSSPSESAVGYYSLKNKELVLYYDPNDPAETLDTLFHEGTHLFVHLAFGEQVQFLPIWLSEGIAEYFGPSRLDRKKKAITFGSPSYGRLRHARALIKGNALSLKGHLLRHTDYGSFGSARYALAWALVHMLIEKKRGKKHKYRAGFVRYFDLVSKNRHPVEGFEEVFGPAARMEQEWLAYIKNFPLPALEEARALAREDKHAEAVPLFEQHCAKNPKDPIGPFQLAESLYELKKYAEAIAAYRRAIALNRNYADAYLGLALSLSFQGQAKESVTAAQQAVAISPTAANYIVLATCALDAKDKPTGQRAIRQAISLAGPSRWLLDMKKQIDAL